QALRLGYLCRVSSAIFQAICEEDSEGRDSVNRGRLKASDNLIRIDIQLDLAGTPNSLSERQECRLSGRHPFSIGWELMRDGLGLAERDRDDVSRSDGSYCGVCDAFADEVGFIDVVVEIGVRNHDRLVHTTTEVGEPP